MKPFFLWALLCISTIAFAQEDLTVSVIDFETQKRTIKDTGLWFQSFLAK